MNTFRVVMTVHLYYETNIDAEDEEEALKKAKQLPNDFWQDGGNDIDIEVY